MTPVLSEIHRWVTECNLKFSYGKYNYTVVLPEFRLKNQPSHPIRVENNKVEFKWHVQYLGVAINAHFSWMPHLDEVQEKAFKFKVLQKMNRLATAN